MPAALPANVPLHDQTVKRITDMSVSFTDENEILNFVQRLMKSTFLSLWR